jgi:hypothetical protein
VNPQQHLGIGTFYCADEAKGTEKFNSGRNILPPDDSETEYNPDYIAMLCYAIQALSGAPFFVLYA